MGLCIWILKLAFGVVAATGLGLFLADCMEFDAGLLSSNLFGLGLGVGGAMFDAGLLSGMENGLPGELVFLPWMFCMVLMFGIIVAVCPEGLENCRCCCAKFACWLASLEVICELTILDRLLLMMLN